MDTQLHRALTLHQSGDLDQAEALYRQILDANPDHADALHLLGMIALARGSVGEAERLVGRAIAQDDANATYHCHLGLVYDADGRTDQAVAEFRRALALDETDLEAWYSLALTLHRAGRLGEAVGAYRELLARTPDDAESWCNFGAALKGTGETDAAIEAYRRAIEIKPDFPEAFYNLGNMLQEQEALDAAATAFRRALSLRPDFAAAACNLGNTLKQAGQIDAAIDAYTQALEIEPDYADAHRMLAFARKHTTRDKYVSAMESLFADAALDDTARIHLGFALGKAHEDLGDYDRAFGFLQQANTLQRATFDYDVAHDAAFFDRLRTSFDASRLAQSDGPGANDPTPIFVLGMPRSGTTLVEQILASHPQVHGAGELSLLDEIAASCSPDGAFADFPAQAAQLDARALAELGDRYLAEVRQRDPAASFVVDKKPVNFRLVGLIRLILPAARIVHCRRDPMDTCLSIYKNFFATHNAFAYDLAELGQYYRLYNSLMAHWLAVSGDAILEVRYEDLIANQRPESERLLAHCGLPWDDACLQFHKTERVVRTASAVQVRQPIFTSSVELWRRYERHLAPLRQALDGD